MKKALIAALAMAAATAGAQPAQDAAQAADEPLNLEQLLEQFNWDFDATEITTEQVAEGLYVLFGAGGNIAVSVGEQGVLVVDDMFPQLIPKVEAAIREIGGDGVDFAINTHWHFDHAEGNLALGPGGTWIAAHANSAQMMAKENILNMVALKYRQQAYPPAARPSIVYDDRMRFHFNGEEIDLVHAGPAHTAGDTAVIFKNHNAVHFGDVFNNTGYPFIDVDSGGSIDGMIAFCQAILDEIGPAAIVIPGHGPVTDSATLQAYIDMLTTVRGRVAEQMAEGKGLMAVVSSGLTGDFDETYGPPSNSLGFLDRVYTSLSRAAP